ncbi:phage baseplate protein [Paenibacillus campinasensis]|uniref:phage baseplate protein n=1 Tax=Paenibacillus campinasensis TaxID=66347 RepID=UPI0018C2B94F|nr:hypothetical protein [Paenibacillus campinasensis]
MAKIDDHYILVESENPTFENEITSQPVEKGVDVSDHVQRKPRTLNLTGFVAGPDASKTREYLKNASDKGRVVWYSGRNTMQGVITGLNTTHDSTVGDGFAFAFTIQEIRVAAPNPAEKLDPPTRAQAAPIINAGVKTTKGKKAASSKSSKSETKQKKSNKKTNDKKNSDKLKGSTGLIWPM